MTNSDHQSFLSVDEFITQSIAFEASSAEFYRELKGKVSGSARELMALLERQEQTHMEILQNLTVPHNVGLIQFPPELMAAMPESPAEGAPLAEWLDHAIERERRAQKAYAQAATQATGSFRELIEALARFEEEHVDRLISFSRM